MKKRVITRRDFLRVAAMTPFAGAFASGFKIQEKKGTERRTKVVLIRDKNALISFKKPNPGVIQRMLDDSITTLLGEKDPINAWKMLVKPSDIVGIKSNVWRPIPTTGEVEQALKSSEWSLQRG